jgi:hypothetical protein
MSLRFTLFREVTAESTLGRAKMLSDVYMPIIKVLCIQPEMIGLGYWSNARLLKRVSRLVSSSGSSNVRREKD